MIIGVSTGIREVARLLPRLLTGALAPAPGAGVASHRRLSDAQHAVCDASEAGVGAPATRVQVGVCTDGVLRAARPRQPVVPKVLG